MLDAFKRQNGAYIVVNLIFFCHKSLQTHR
jgi:hypothetical protein